METAALTTRRTSSIGLIVRLAKFAAPALVTIVIGWGTVQFTQGRNSHRLDKVETDLEETLTRQEFQTWANQQTEMLRSTNQKADNLITREEFRIFTEQQRDRFSDLKEYLRTMKRQ